MQVAGAAVAPGPFAAEAFVGFDEAVDVESAVHEGGGVEAAAVDGVGAPEGDVAGVEGHVADARVILVLRDVVGGRVVRVVGDVAVGAGDDLHGAVLGAVGVDGDAGLHPGGEEVAEGGNGHAGAHIAVQGPGDFGAGLFPVQLVDDLFDR